MFRFAAVLLVVLGFGLTVASRGTTASDKPGCEGLGEYRKAMFVAGRSYIESAEKFAPGWQAREVTSFSSDEWTGFADAALQMQRDLKDITPPPWAKSWHDLQVARSGFSEQVFRTIVRDGLLVAAALLEDGDAIETKLEAAADEISKTCESFAGFVHDWNALDGEIDGTPVATPSD